MSLRDWNPRRPDTVPIRLNADQPVITSKNFAWRVPPSTELEPGDSYFVRLVSSVAPQFVATSVPISIRGNFVFLLKLQEIQDRVFFSLH